MTEARRVAESLLVLHNQLRAPVDPEWIAEKEGVDVQFVTFNGEAAEKIHGFYDHDEKTIFVNAEDSAQEKQFTIAHELGHHKLHQEYSASEKYVPRLKAEVGTAEEIEADDFATSLLVPASVIHQYSSVVSDEKLSAMFLVNRDVIARAKAIVKT